MLAFNVRPLGAASFEVAHVLSEAAGFPFLEAAEAFVVEGADESPLVGGTHTSLWQAIEQLLEGGVGARIGFGLIALATLALTLAVFAPLAVLTLVAFATLVRLPQWGWGLRRLRQVSQA